MKAIKVHQLRESLRFCLLLTSLAAALILLCGCQRQSTAGAAAQPQVTVTPMLGGAGGLMLQISRPDSVSIYHLPPKALDRTQQSPNNVELDLILQFDPNEAGGERLPVRLKPSAAPDHDATPDAGNTGV